MALPGMTKKELATLAGYTYRRLHDIDMEQPRDKKLFVRSEADDKKFDPAIFVQRWVAYNKSATEQENEELSVVKAQHERVKKEKTELEVARMKGEYVEVQEVHRLWGNIATVIRSRFVNLARKLAPALVMIENPDRIEEIIDRDVRDALNMIANTPLPGEDSWQMPEEDYQTPDEEDEDE